MSLHRTSVSKGRQPGTAIIVSTPVPALSAPLKRGFEDLALQLSPENLTDDGLLADAQVQARIAAIQRQWADLESRAGHQVTQDDVWKWQANHGDEEMEGA